MFLTDESRPLLGEIGSQLTDMAETLCGGLGQDALEATAAVIASMRDRAQEQRAAAGEEPPPLEPDLEKVA